MKTRYSHELPRWMRFFGVKRINDNSIDFVWGYFAPRPSFQLLLHRGGYFDTRYAISIALGYGVLHFYLPFRTRLKEGCDMPQYGIHIHNNTFWIMIGGDYDESIGQVQGKSWITWDLPFFSHVFDGHWIVDRNMQWVLIERDAYKFREDHAYTELHPYTYRLKNGIVQSRTATCCIEKRKWHRKWFPFLTTTKQVIDVEFSDEVGERSGTWKGGTIGCSYDMLPGETVQSCLGRMEKERDF